MFLLVLPLVLLSEPPVLTEVAANPLSETSGEFVEVFNPSTSPVCVADYSITDGDALDFIVPWSESVHGPFPHPGMLLETDTIPPGVFAIILELDYPDDPVLSIEPGTIILTTGDHAICNGLAASSDPLTLFDGSGSADSCAVSTYGTPVPSDQWQDRDDDGLDGIPFDPGDGNTVERYPWSSPDQEGAWFISPPGGTPGRHASAQPDTMNVSCSSVWTIPAEPEAWEPFQVFAAFTCTGNSPPESGSLTIFLDSQGDSTAGPGEVLAVFDPSTLQPGATDTFSVVTSLEQGWYLPSAIAEVTGDTTPNDDMAALPLPVGGGVNVVVTEVMANPLEEDFGEYLEVHYPGPGIMPLAGCSFTDGDALDIVAPWEEGPLADPDAVYSAFLISGAYALVMDPEYVMGGQSYDLAPGTVVMTVGNTTLGNGLTGNDPITFYGPYGTEQADVHSTYGTPIASEDPLSCDDDGLDGIPFDPGENISVERLSPSMPDVEFAWAASPAGGTPGLPADQPDSTDAGLQSLTVHPEAATPGEMITLTAVVANLGTTGLQSCIVTVFMDSDADSLPGSGEVLAEVILPAMAPGDSDTVTVSLTSPEPGGWLTAALVSAEGDQNESNDLGMAHFTSGAGVLLVITEVLCNPEVEDFDEFIELFYPGPGVFDVTDCRFTDGDALDLIVGWDPSYGVLQPPGLSSGPWLPQGSYALVLDREYASGGQPYQMPPGTVVLTTGNTTLGDGLTSTDPVTLYAATGTMTTDVMSTYGTPLASDDPLLRDDDGLDGIPLDPGEGNSVQRIGPLYPDMEGSWAVSAAGPTPGDHPPVLCTGVNTEAVNLECSPPMGPGDLAVELTAKFTNTGMDTLPEAGLTVGFYVDQDGSGHATAEELLGSLQAGPLTPGDTLDAVWTWEAVTGSMGLIVTGTCELDSFPDDDVSSCVWNPAPSVVMNEIMYAPEPGRPEWVELTACPGIAVLLLEWSFEDSRESTVFCSDSLTILEDSFVILTSDSSGFMEHWPEVDCPVLQPPSWPALNNSTQQGETWADRLIIRDGEGTPVDYVPYDDDWGGSQGVSIERKGSLFPGWDAGSWAGCTCGGTPGTENSCALQGSEGGFLEYGPDPFSPDGDGNDDVLSISVNPEWDVSEITLTVYNVQGRVVAELAARESCSGSMNKVWDGTDDHGGRLPVGRYIVYVDVRGTVSGEHREACGVVILARVL